MKSLKTEIQNLQSPSFDPLIQRWEKKHGVAAFRPLVQIAEDRANSEMDRYVAFMSAAKLGGKASLPELQKFLKDPSWMLRSGALRILSAYGDSEVGTTVFPLLHDPALVVRMEAVETIGTLKPLGSVEALYRALEDPDNYHRGRALWVPQKVLRALVTLRAKDVTDRILALVRSPQHRSDSEFVREAEKTIRALKN